MNTFARLCGGLLLLGLTGCGGGAPVAKGKVALDGEVVTVGSIQFVPVDGTTGPTTGGEIRDGNYVTAYPVGGEPVPGTYRVEIRWPKKTGKKLPPNIPPPPGAPPGTELEEVIEVIPEKFNKNSELKRELKPGSNTHDFDLKKAS